MGAYRLRRRIAAPPDRVFEAFSNPAWLVDWMNMDRVMGQSDTLDTPGARFSLVFRGPWRFRCEVVRADRPNHYEFAGRAPLGAWFRMLATINPSGAGSELDLLTEYGPPLGPVGRWLDRRFLDREPRTTANRELDRLVEIVSASPATAAVATG